MHRYCDALKARREHLAAVDCFFRDLPEIGCHMPRCTCPACRAKTSCVNREASFGICLFTCADAFRGELIACQWRIEAIETQQRALRAEVTEAEGLRRKSGALVECYGNPRRFLLQQPVVKLPRQKM